MQNEIKIIGNNGCKLIIQNILLENTYFSACVYLKSDWYEASIDFTSSNDRLIEFTENINSILTNEKKSANFINEDGNFDLDIIVNETTGNLQISGVAIKSMIDESRLEYSMEADFHNLENLQSSLSDIILELKDQNQSSRPKSASH